MAENERHEMTLVNRLADGAEEWFCPICGRRFLMTWPPQFNRQILEPGNENVIHVGGKGLDIPMLRDLGLRDIRMTFQEDAEKSELPEHFNNRCEVSWKTDPYLKVYEEFLKGLPDVDTPADPA